MEGIYYRNRDTIISLEGIEIDTGALWELNENNLLVLVDEDQYVSYKLDLSLFYKAI